MFYFAKKIIYLSFYEENRKKCAAGFARIRGEGEMLSLALKIEKAGKEADGEFPLFLLLPFGKLDLGTVKLREGAGGCERSLDFQENMRDIRSTETGILITLSAKECIKGGWEEKEKEEEKEEEKEKGEEKGEEKEEELHTEDGKDKGKREEQPKEENNETERSREGQAEKESGREHQVAAAQFYGSSKWEQLLLQYPNVHPFGDERVFVSLEPKDFVVLREKDQRLVNNSFLLHGFYNYRHVILGKDGRIGNGLETCFYIGVPGAFYEREKMVAVMFGFEGFECEGAVENGKFGYYMRQVEI